MAVLSAILGGGGLCALDVAMRVTAASTAADAALDRCLWPETGAALEAEAAAARGDTAGLLWRVHQAYQTGGRRALLNLARLERRPGLAAYLDRARRRCGWSASADWRGSDAEEANWWGLEDDGVEEEEEEAMVPEWAAAAVK